MLKVSSAGTHPASRVNPWAVKVMKEVSIDISHQIPEPVSDFTGQEWDYVITVCSGAKEVCPAFTGKVKHRFHIGFDDPADAVGSQEAVIAEYRRIRDEIKDGFYGFFMRLE